jgi:hypothetical protein
MCVVSKMAVFCSYFIIIIIIVIIIIIIIIIIIVIGLCAVRMAH